MPLTLTSRKLSSTGRDPAEYNFYHIWVRRAIDSQQNENQTTGVDPSRFGAETLLDLASESRNPSRAPTPPQRLPATASAAEFGSIHSQDDLVPRVGCSQDPSSLFDETSSDPMNWPPTLGDLSMPLYQHDGDQQFHAQTLELDPLSGLFPTSWTEGASGILDTGEGASYETSLWE